MNKGDAALPAGNATFVFTDIEGSTPLLRALGHERYEDALNSHRRLIRDAVARHGGVEVKTEGDGFFIAFADAGSAVAACIDAQLALRSHPWPPATTVRVRMGVHTGLGVVTEDRDYVGQDVHLAARVAAAAHGGQILVSDATRAHLTSAPPGAAFDELGRFTLRGFDDAITLHQLIHPDLETTFPPVRAASAVVHNLPIIRSMFIGRDAERRDLRKLLQLHALVTAVGPGGVGKTRLALEVAQAATAEFEDGVWLVELAPITMEISVADTVARALGIPEVAGVDATAAVIERVRDAKSLLVLDNAEHVIDDCAAFVDRLLRECASVVILATSRERLGVRGEQVWDVAPLGTAARASADVDAVSQAMESDGVRLFVDRARLASRSFVLDHDNVSAVVDICARLEGIPLALELAATRVADTNVMKLCAQLDDRFAVLTSGYRTDSDRQRTLWGAIDWSYQLLDERARAILRSVAVFRRGFTVDAAIRVVTGAREPEQHPDPGTIAEVLHTLADRSLLDLDFGEEPVRFRMLESIREFALRKLQDAGEHKGAVERHREWALAFAEEADAHLPLPDAPEWFHRLDIEHDNCRAAIEAAAADHDRASEHVDLVAALGRYWEARGFLREGRDRIRLALERSNVANTSRIRALISEARIDLRLALSADARAALTEARSLSAELGDDKSAVIAVMGLGNVALQQADYDAALEAYTNAKTLYDVLDVPTGAAAALSGLGSVHLYLGRLDEARAYHEQSLQLYRDAGHARGIATGLTNLADIARLQHDYDAAVALLGEAQEVAASIGDQLIECASMTIRSTVLMQKGDDDEAEAMANNALRRLAETGFSELATTCHTNLAVLARRRNDIGRAARAMLDAIAVATAEAGPYSVVGAVEFSGVIAVDADRFEEGCLLLAAAITHRTDDRTSELFTTAWETSTSALGDRADEVRSAGAAMTVSEAADLARAVMTSVAEGTTAP